MSAGKNFAGIIAFMKVATHGGFNAAARELGISAPAVSRSVARLESRLNVRLLDRSTHHVSLTPEGLQFFEECLPSVDHLTRAVENMKDAGDVPAGLLRVSATVGFGRKCVAPLLPAFCQRYPRIRLEFDLDDRHTNFAGDQVDVAIRNGRIQEADIVAKKIAPMRLIVCAAPGYLEQAGAPAAIDDLKSHRIIAFRLKDSGKPHEWEFKVDGKLVKLALPGHQVFNDPELVAQAALAGNGLAQLANYQADSHIASGRLIPLLADLVADGRGHYACYRNRRQMPLRIRLFIDYLQTALGGATPA
ncbi:LysR family transcriptional regulator [Achromobacter sp. HZ01]|nr:LysR family transcriptional regulator [Achromobacter sp. HZ01]